jgi:hypothetical protein
LARLCRTGDNQAGSTSLETTKLCNNTTPKEWTLLGAFEGLTPEELFAEYKGRLKAWEEEINSGRSGICRSYPLEAREIHRFKSNTDAWRYAKARHERRLLQQVKDCEVRLWQFLKDELASENLLAKGCPNDASAEPVIIRSNSWRHIRKLDWKQSAITVDGNPPKIFYEVRIFPAPEKLGKKRHAMKRSALEDCEDWLAAMMTLNSKHKERPKKAYYNEACKKFGWISTRDFDEVWKKAIGRTESDWDRSGRPPKSSQENPRKK